MSTMTATVRKLVSGESREINGYVFVYFHSNSKPQIGVYAAGMVIDSIDLTVGEMTTTQHFEEKIMWWALEYNQI